MQIRNVLIGVVRRARSQRMPSTSMLNVASRSLRRRRRSYMKNLKSMRTNWESLLSSCEGAAQLTSGRYFEAINGALLTVMTVCYQS